MWRHVLAEIEKNLVHITPPPALRRIIAFDDGVMRGSKVLGGMAAGGFIATSDMAASAAYAQMYPRAAGFQAFFASSGARRDDRDMVLMRTYLFRHGRAPNSMAGS
jgi:hypothetical protein